ncbi:hypothetical protein MKX01_036911 [Papaver californicum]|nr:hypothetical protein MKX01_036911 [Papaver californicum]
MKSSNLLHLLSVLFLSSLLFLTASALTDDETNSTTLTGHTNSNDVEAIQLLIDNYPSLGFLSTDDQDDPCLPEPYSWVNCSSDDIPRITALILGNSGALSFGADLPDFSIMDALEFIDLSNNILRQEFPDFLADFPKLKLLNLANNYLTGTVPTSLRKKSEENTFNLTLTGEGMNQLCFSDEDVCPTATWTKASPGTHWGIYGRILVKSSKKKKTSSVKSGKKKKPKKKKKTPLFVVGILIIILVLFVLLLAFVKFLHITYQERKHASRKNQERKEAAAAVPSSAAHYQDSGTAANDMGVKTDKQMHPAV